MKYGLFLVAILIVGLVGCGASNDDSGDAAETAEAANTEASNTTSGHEADAESMTSSAGDSSPAVDTSDLTAAPEWTLYDLAGTAVTSEQFAGQVVIVDFWATWCGPCRKSIPDLIELHDEYKDQGVTIVGVSLDQKGPSVVEPFVEKMKIQYPVVMGNQQIVNDFGGVRGIPTAFVISQDGKIYQKYVGLRPRAEYEKDIKALLGLSS